MADAVPTAPDMGTPQAPTQTVKVYAPDGQRGTVPAEQYQEFAKLGYQLAVPVYSDKGEPGTVPVNDFGKFQKQGYKFRTDSLQVPATVKLIKALNEKEPTSALEFLEPWGDAITSALPEHLQKAVKEGGWKNWLATAVEATPAYQLGVTPIKATWDGLVQAAKKPTASEASAFGAAQLIPFAPNVARATELLTEHAAPGDPGETHVAKALGELSIPVAAMVVPEVAGKTARAAQRQAMQRARNLGMQRVVTDLVKQLPEGDVTQRLRELAKSDVQAANVAEENRVQGIMGSQQAVKDAADFNILADRLQREDETLQKEDARRVQSLSDFNNYANNLVGVHGGNPYERATEAIDVLNKKEGVVDSIEHHLFEPAAQRAEQEGVRPQLTETLQSLERSIGVPARTQYQLGTSTLTPPDLMATQKMREFIAGVHSELQAMALGEGGTLAENQRQALAGVLAEVGEGRATQVPFAVANEAQAGLGKVIRKLQRAGGTENDTRTRVLGDVQAGLKRDIQTSMVGHPELEELYNQARKVTLEQHENIDKNFIQGFYKNERNRWNADALTRLILKPKVQAFHEALAKGFEFGPEAQAGLRMIERNNPEQGAALARRVVDITNESAQAKAGLRRSVVDEMLKVGTKASNTPGVVSPEFDYDKMASWLRDRPGAKVILGDSYDRMLTEVDRLSAEDLQRRDAPMFKALQKVTAMYEAKQRISSRMGARMLKAQSETEKIYPNPQAKALFNPQNPMSMSGFTQKFAKDPDFRDYVAPKMTDIEKQKVARSMVQRAMNDNLLSSAVPGEPDAAFDLEGFGKSIGEMRPAFEKLGNPEAAKTVQAIGRLAENAKITAGSGLAARFYAFIRLFKTPAGEPRMSMGERRGSLSTGPQTLLKEFHAAGKEPFAEVPQMDRSFSDDLAAAIQDPKLAEMMRKAMTLKPWQPGAGTFALRYLVAFSSAKRGPGEKRKELDDTDAQGFLRESGGDIQKAVGLAQERGY